jgi:hypothetical protein
VTTENVAMLLPEQFLEELRRRGALRLSRVSFRANRSTVWSITQRGRVLNLHSAFGSAPSAELFDAFATLLREGGLGSRDARRAGATISAWPGLAPALRRARAERPNPRESACCATSEQVAYLRTLYRYLNETRFDGRLPGALPVRLSNRMGTSLGHMWPAEEEGAERSVVEIALNVDLMLEGNGAERFDTLLHEMAHVADYLLTGNRGHGKSWRDWARRVGCRAERLYHRPVRRRRSRRTAVTRVPPLPPALAAPEECYAAPSRVVDTRLPDGASTPSTSV